MSQLLKPRVLIIAQWFKPTLSLQLGHQSCPVLEVLAYLRSLGRQETRILSRETRVP
jgi:hypothetical protein